MSLNFRVGSGAGSRCFDFWNEVVCRHQVVVAMDSQDKGSFDASMDIRDWGDIRVANFVFSSIEYLRGIREIRLSDRDDFICDLIVEGHGAFDSGAGHVECRTGDIIFYDANQVYGLRFPTSARTISMRMPRPLVVGRLPQADHKFALHLRGGRSMTGLAANLMTNASAVDDMPSALHSKSVGLALLDILCVAAKDSLGEEQTPSPGQIASLKRIKRELMEQLGDCTLEVEGIAKAQGISARTLNRMFAAEGTTVMRWLWKQRLSSSYRALSEGKLRQVTEAAFSFGFKDTSHFTRAFKKEFNMLPHTLVWRN